jgi:hypothetical protein
MALVKATNVECSILESDMPMPTIGPDDNLSSIVRDYAKGFLSEALNCSAYVSNTPNGPQIIIGSDAYDDTGFSLNLVSILVEAVEELGVDQLRKIVENAIEPKDPHNG